MRHRVYGRHFGRSKDERTALFKSLVQSLFLSESIQTTEPKAKAIKGLVDKLITQAKSPSTKKLVSQFLNQKNLSEKLIKDIAPRFKDRVSGYTSIIHLGKRVGDGASMVRMSLVEGPSAVIPSKARNLKIKEEVVKEEKKEEKVYVD